MVYLSKSKYCGLWQCPKIAWLKKYKPEEIKVDPQVIARMDAGNEVGDLAMGLFGDYIEVTAFDGDKIDIKQMIENTKAKSKKVRLLSAKPRSIITGFTVPLTY